ncbi:MAG: TetR/AcrR family transcriptional regulator [Cyanobacteria bacterium P01_A01_bin.137]
MVKSGRDASYHHGDLRQALIDGALALIRENQDGETLSMREVARRAGVSNAAPYRHFADKDALLAAVAEKGFRLLTAALKAGLDSVADDPVRSLQASGVAYVKFAIAYPAYYRVMFSALQPGEPTCPELNDAGDEAFSVLVGAITQGQTADKLKPGDPPQLAWVAWSLVHGLAMLVIERQLPLTDEASITAFAELAVQTLGEGLNSAHSSQ